MGRGNAIHFTTKYDVKEVISFLMTIFDYLKLIVQKMSIVPSDGPNGVAIEIKEEDIDIFVSDYPWKTLPKLVVGKLFLFQRLFIPLFESLNPLA